MEVLTVSSIVTYFLLSSPKCVLNIADLGIGLSLKRQIGLERKGGKE